MAVDGDAIWITNAASRTLTQIDGRSGEVVSSADLRHAPAAIVSGNDEAWVVCENGWLWRFSSGDQGEGVARLGDGARGVACDRESVWTLHGNGRLLGVDRASGETSTEAKVRHRGRQLLHADGSLLALVAGGSRVSRIAIPSGEIEAEAKLPAPGMRAALHESTLWVACERRLASRWGALVPIDLATMAVGAPLRLPTAPRAVASGAGSVWVACGRRREKATAIVRVDPASSELVPWAESEWTIYDLGVSEDRLLAATGLTLGVPVDPGNGVAGGWS